MLKSEFKLRQYQEDFIKELGKAIVIHRRVIGCAATGSGKSKTFLRISVNAIDKNYTVLIITESRKIYKQLIDEVHAIEIKPGTKPKITTGRIYLAMAQTLRRRPILIEQFKLISEKPTDENKGLLIINDECHVNEATGILLKLPKALLLGFSGSPVGKHLVKLYNHLVVGPQPHELVLEGFLSPYIHFERKRADMSQLERDSLGEYTGESQENVFGTRQVFDGLIDDLKNIQFKKCVIYCANIAACEKTAEELRQAGFKCVTVHSGLQCNEEYNLMQFTHGLMPICVTVNMLNKGFDFPPIDLIALLIKTTSLSRYLQAIGRASRILKIDEGKPIEQRLKKYFTVLDYGENCSIDKGGHLPWDFERDWTELWKSKPKKPGVSPIKVCPKCEMINKAAAKKCFNCGHEWMTLNIQEDEPKPDTVLVEITGKYNALRGRMLSSLTPEELSIYAKSKGKKGFAQIICKKHALSGNREFIKEYGRAMGYNHYWAKYQLDSLEGLTENQLERFNYKDTDLK